MLDPLLREEKPVLHHWNIIPKQKLVKCETEVGLLGRTIKASKSITTVTWTVGDIAKAGGLLAMPPIQTNFEDEQEMRRVYTLIYDVFRYKNVLMQALNDISFFQVFPKLLSNVPHVWLLFYDLSHRLFKKRETKFAKLAYNLFDTYGLTYTENALWTQRIKLAASVARLRIKHNALSLSELLPPHLRDERVSEQAKNNPVTCWINSIKVSDAKQLCKELEEQFSLKLVGDVKKIGHNNFTWDRHCPQIIAFHASLRSEVTRSTFVKNNLLIVQDKSFCLGPATFGRLIQDLELTGSVIQTHVNSPRTTAYLATLLSQNEKIKQLMAFSAGKRKQEYEAYFTQLGMNNIVIYSDRLIDTPVDANYMEEVVAVFATPPNSYSAVSDPIDLVCSRGGDLSMLEVLTESSDTKETKERVASVLEEQRKTLRFAMSRPQIQFVLYETHSELDAENESMVNKTLKEINRIAKLQHATLQGKIATPTEQESDIKEINNNDTVQEECSAESIVETDLLESNNSEEEMIEIREKILDSIRVPDTDIFDTPSLPVLCDSEVCKNFEKQGCYLALLQRKQIIRLDDKYMIQMAENRGLFGSNTTSTTVKSKSSKTSKKKIEKEKPHKPRKKIRDSEEGENCISNVSSHHDDKENFLLTENCQSSREVGISVRNMVSKNILANFSSAHIRQFVSPFYKPPQEPKIPKKTVQNFKTKTGDNSRPKSKKIHSSANSSATSSLDYKKNKKLAKVVNRLCLPTQNCILKTIKEEPSNNDNKKPAIEYAKRIYHCDQCRKRNIENSRN